MKPRHVQAVAMTIQYGVRGMILAVQSEAFKQDNVPWVGSERDEAHASRSPVLWVEIGESSLTGLELVQEMTDKFEVGDHVLLKVGIMRFGKEDEIKVDKTLRFVEEPVENSDREVKRLKCSRIVVVKAKLLAVRYHVKVSWNSKCNFELTWVWEDYLKDKYPRLIVWLVKPLVVTYESVVMYGLCVYMRYVDYVRVGNQSIERDRLIGIGLVMDLVKFLSFTFGGKEMTFGGFGVFALIVFVLVFVEAAKHQ
ncbi:hypothetical protein Tco_1261096, partial [Tanacetum coccineum]